MGGKWSRNEAFNAGMHTNGEGFYCGNLDYETWENKLYSSWVNECARGMHPREEVCFTVNQNEWRWMKFIHRLPLYKKIQNVHKQRYFGGLHQPSIRPLFTSDPTLMQSKKLVSYSTCWGSCTVFYIYIFFLMPVKSWHACFFPFCRDPWLTATPVRMWMRSSGSLTVLLYCVWYQYVCANVSWFLGISGPGGLSDSLLELTVCHCHNIKATIRHADTSVPPPPPRADTCEYSCSCSPALTCQPCQWLFFSLIAVG